MIDYGKDRNSDNHSDESEKAAEKHNCEQYPEAVEVSHLTKNFRTKYVAVKLLQDNYKYNKPYTFYRAYHKYEKSGRNSSDKRSEKRYDVRNADKHADKKRIRHFHNTKANETEYADYG